jgi:hypothetical protein
MGFFSRATEEAQRLPQAKGTGEQMRAMLLKQGVKPDELKWTGFDEWAKGKKSVTRDEVTEFLRRNEVQLGEKRLGKDTTPLSYEEWVKRNYPDSYTKMIEARANNDAETFQSLNMILGREWNAGMGTRVDGATKFEQYTLPGGKDYSELLLTRPPKETQAFAIRYKDGPQMGSSYASEDEARAALREMFPNRTDLEIVPERATSDGVRTGRALTPDNYRSQHWDDPNVLAHMRMSGRTDPEGRRVLHLEELQSDWAQEGRKKGFRSETSNADLVKQYDALNAERRQLHSNIENGVDVQQSQERLASVQTNMERMSDQMAVNRSAPPSAPFVESTPGWTNLALKRAMIEAARGNYDAIAWTPGAEQAKRYNLSQHIGELEWSPDTNRLVAYGHNGEAVINRTATPDELSGLVGKEVAERLVATPPTISGNEARHTLSGLDLDVGGKGMKGYYDKILPTQIGKVLKDINETPQFGTVNISNPARPSTSSREVDDLYRELADEDPPAMVGGGNYSLPSINLTPQMREKINQGLPLFTMMPAAVGLGATASQMQEGQNPAAAEEQQGFADGGKIVRKALEAVRGLPKAVGLEEFMPAAGKRRLPKAVGLEEFMRGAGERRLPSTPSIEEFMPTAGERRLPDAVGLEEFMPSAREPRLPEPVGLEEFMPIDRAGGGKVVRKALEAIRGLPPAENSRLTQIATTGPSYDKALRHLDRAGIEGRAIDYGAGRGHGMRGIGADTFEPYPQGWTPTFTKPEDIPDDVYRRLVNLNVLNVLGPEARDAALLNMGRVVEPGGGGVISTRGRDVMSARGEPGPEPMSLIIGEGDAARYQKGFTPRELREYVGDTLGPRFDVDPADVGQASVLFRRNRENGGPVDMRAGEMIGLRARLGLSPKKISDRAGPIHTDPAVAAARDAATVEAEPAVVEQALDVVRSQPAARPEPRALTVPAPRPAAPEPSESQRLWQLYNESESPADFVRADEAMRAGRASGGRLLEDQYPTQYLPDVGRQVMQDGGAPEDYVSAQGRRRSTLEGLGGFEDRPVMDPETMGQNWANAVSRMRVEDYAKRPEGRSAPPRPPEQFVRPFTPSIRDEIGQAIAGDDRFSHAGELRGRFADLAFGSTGTPGSGRFGIGLADAARLTGIPLQVSDVSDAVSKGDYLGAALGTALPAAFYARKPIMAAGRAVYDAGRRAVDVAGDVLGRVPAPIAAAGAGAAAMTPEEAQAGKLDAAVRAAKKIVAPAEKRPDLFDYSRLGDVPHVRQFDLPRNEPPRGVPPRVTEMIANPDVRDEMLKTIEQGERMGGSRWYNADPLRDKFVEQFGTERGGEAFRKYMDFVAATSPRSEVGANVRNASYYYNRAMSGQGMPPVGERNPAPYGHLAQRLHQMNAERVAGAGWDPLNNPKPASFVENLVGNQQPVTVDTHAFRLPAIIARDPRFLETAFQVSKDAPKQNIAKMIESGEISLDDAASRAAYWQAQPKANEYAALEQYYKSLGRDLGLTPAQTQAAAWVGGGARTGLKSDESKPFLRFVEDRIYKTADERNMDPQDVMRMFVRGESPLYARGGSVSHRAMMIAKELGSSPRATV